jgi:6,7-dimethyl-8-ribityllumazine synthase
LNVQTDIPVIFFCVLTTMQQSIDRSGGIHGNKGTEADIALLKWLYSSTFNEINLLSLVLCG